MRLPKTLAASLVIAALMSPSAVAQSSQAFENGMWEITSIGPRDDNPRQRTICVSPETPAQSNIAPIARALETGQRKCEPQSVEKGDGTLRFTTRCSAPIGSIKLQSSGTYSSTQFEITSTGRAMGRDLKMEMRGRRVSACKS